MDKIREYVKAQIKKRYPLYNVADELGTSMYTSDIRETVAINYDGLTRELTKQVMRAFKELDHPLETGTYELDTIEFDIVLDDETIPLDLEVDVRPQESSFDVFEIIGEADDEGIYIYIDYLKDEVPNIYNEMLPYLKGVIRHELEHIGQYYVRGEEDIFEPSPINKKESFVDYLLDPTEVEAHVKELNSIRKSQKVSFEQALEDYFDRYIDNFSKKSDVEKVRKAFLEKASELQLV